MADKVVKDELNLSLERLLNEVDYAYLNTVYVPSPNAVEFINFIKMVNGAEGEENKSPVIHLDMIDNANKEDSNLFVAARGTAKTTCLHEYAYLYMGTYGEFFDFGEVSVAMYISDTIDNGVKSMRKNLQFRYENSEFLQKYIPEANFTDVRWEFINTEGHRFCVRGFGASTGVRGFKEYGKRPTWCHAVGTVVTTNEGTHKVEEYSNAFIKEDSGYVVTLCGLTESERVTEDHMYWVKTTHAVRAKEYLSNGSTKSSTSYLDKGNGWVHTKDLNASKSIGNQTKETHWIGEPIDTTVCDIPFQHRYVNNKDWWWLYGLWMADGFRSSRHLSWCIADTQERSVGARVINILTSLGYGYTKRQRKGCYTLTISDASWSKLLKEYKRGNSIKDLPEWTLTMKPELQKAFIDGYIAGDGYVTETQTRINSVNPVILRQMGKMLGRLGIPYTIRNTKKAGTELFPNGQLCEIQAQEELRISHKKVDKYQTHVFIEDGFIWRKFKAKSFIERALFVPITTPDHTYTSSFGLSHNCGLDDLMSDKNAESPTIVKDITNIIYKAARQAMHPKKRKMVWTGTPFNKKDPLYKAAGSKAWNTKVYPICQKFPCTREEFQGAWEDRFSYDFIKGEYESLRESGQIEAFNQELMLRISSDEDRLVLDSDIKWFNRSHLIPAINNFNIYITTDFATSEEAKADFSTIGVWAVNHIGQFFLIDGICKRQSMDKNIEDLFFLVQQYSPQSVGIEVSGQQGGFISIIQAEMMKRNVFFNLASENNQGKAGVRPAGKKFVRFHMNVVPWFKQGLIHLPEDMKDHPLVMELVEELSSVTLGGFKSAHDDACDLLSMLSVIPVWRPSAEQTRPIMEGAMWSEMDDDDGYDDASINSYVV